MISRRKFFSFFGTVIALLAKPDLFIPKATGKIKVVFVGPNEVKWFYFISPAYKAIVEREISRGYLPPELQKYVDALTAIGLLAI